MDDDTQLKILIAKMASDSLAKKQTKDEWRERLEAMLEAIQFEIDAI